MKYKNSLELKDKISNLQTRCHEIINTCKTELRDMTEDEEREFEESKNEIQEMKEELKSLREKLDSLDSEIPENEESDDEPENKSDDEPDNKEEKNTRNRKMKNTFSLVKEIRNALKNNQKQIHVNAETRSMTVNGYGSGESKVAGVHDEVIETEIQGILEPLYAKSVLAQLGVKFYTGLPQGDIQIPIMGKGNVGWAGEIASATESTNTFTTKKLQPKRLTAYVDVSKMLLAQDSIGVENAIRNDIVNALNDQLESTILGSGAKTDNKPQGIFNGKELKDGKTFANLTQLESEVEDNNITGDLKYLLSTGAKADLRAMSKSTKNTQLVMENGTVDGVQAITTSNVKTAGSFVYGDFSNLAVGSWGDIEITIDEYTQAINGCVRLIVNAYFDAVVLRDEAFVFGTTR